MPATRDEECVVGTVSPLRPQCPLRFNRGWRGVTTEAVKGAPRSRVVVWGGWAPSCRCLPREMRSASWEPSALCVLSALCGSIGGGAGSQQRPIERRDQGRGSAVPLHTSTFKLHTPNAPLLPMVSSFVSSCLRVREVHEHQDPDDGLQGPFANGPYHIPGLLRSLAFVRDDVPRTEERISRSAAADPPEAGPRSGSRRARCASRPSRGDLRPPGR